MLSTRNYAIGGDITVSRLGFGAMSITGPGVWGEPIDRSESLRTLRCLPELGVSFIDTADSYGPEISEKLIREALYPYTGMLVATKAGFTRSGPNKWSINGHPKHLRKQALHSCKLLGMERIDLWQLHRIDKSIDRHNQFTEIRALLDDGIIRHVGLSEVSIEDIEEAHCFFPVATVQNRYNLFERQNEDVLRYCEKYGIGFICWNPLGAGHLIRPNSILDHIAKEINITAGQLALAWILQHSHITLPIPGTSKVDHLKDNCAAININIPKEIITMLDKIGIKN